MKRTIKLIISIALIVLLVCLLFSCKTRANWTEQRADDSSTDANIETVNGSEKYIVFAALKNKEGGGYELIASSDTGSAATAYAVVGYTGLVAELVIPDRYTDTSIYDDPESDDDSLPVTEVLVATPYASYKCSMNGASYPAAYDDARLANNTVVKSIVFGSEIIKVGAGVCTTMVNLESISFKSNSEVGLGDYAFAYCVKLQTVSLTEQGLFSDANGTAFTGCIYTPPAPEPEPEPEPEP